MNLKIVLSIKKEENIASYFRKKLIKYLQNHSFWWPLRNQQKFPLVLVTLKLSQFALKFKQEDQIFFIFIYSI